MTITAAQIKDLREKTGAGMMKAKEALQANDGDMEAAIDWLREKGLATAEKKSSRTAAEGLVALAVSEDGKKAVALEVNAETDFVARNAEFQQFVAKAAQGALQSGAKDIEEFKNITCNETGKTPQDMLTDLIAKIGENMTLRRLTALEVSEGVIGAYVHNAAAPNMGKIVALVALESSGDATALQTLGKQLGMHVAAAFPQYLDKESVDDDAMERERAILIEQAKAEGKPDDIAEKMVEGRMKKFYQEICLLEQIYVIDGETRVADVVTNAEKDTGAPVKLTAFVRMQLGEGIEKEETDFAAEVAATVQGG